MKTYLDCVPCFLRQALDSSRLLRDDEAVHERVLRRVLDEVRRLDLQASPPAMGQRIHRVIRRELEDPDPYRALKERFTEQALRTVPDLQTRIARSPDPLEAAVRLAIVGNLIDFGPTSALDEATLDAAIQDAFHAPLHGDYAAFEQALAHAGDVLYLADNAGEIVFDRLLVERLSVPRVTVAVRGHPVINDATRIDAERAGFPAAVQLMDNGSDAPATLLEDCSDTFRQAFWDSDLIIAKGQGNYESLSNVPRRVFFLLKAKCDIIARDLGCPPGALVLARTASAKSIKSSNEP